MSECEQCLQEHALGIHCSLDSRGRYVGCHETFLNIDLYSEHLHKTTRGCKWPGDIEDFYRKEGIWHKKEKKEEQEDTPAQSRNSNSSRGAAKRSTSNGSRDRKYQDDQQLGPSWG